MAISQNGWQVVESISECKQWHIPTFDTTTIPLRGGAAGFILVHWAMWFHQRIESLDATPGDDFGWALRKIGGSDEWSNHASGTAIDLNASKHPQGHQGTFSDEHTDEIRERLVFYNGVIKWGGDFRSVKDEMHFEIQGSHGDVLEVHRVLRKTPRGQAIAAVN